jgi:hypothetical protein
MIFLKTNACLTPVKLDVSVLEAKQCNLYKKFIIKTCILFFFVLYYRPTHASYGMFSAWEWCCRWRVGPTPFLFPRFLIISTTWDIFLRSSASRAMAPCFYNRIAEHERGMIPARPFDYCNIDRQSYSFIKECSSKSDNKRTVYRIGRK